MKKLFSFIALILLSITFVGCSPTQTYAHSLSEVIEALEITYAEGDDADSITQNILLPLTSDLETAARISWVTDNSSVINIFGFVNRQQMNTVVELTLSVTLGTNSDQKVFSLTVTGLVGGYIVEFYDDDRLLSSSVLDDQALITPIDDPTKIEHVFLGWSTTPVSDTYFTFNQPITGNVTLYAQWEFTSIYTYTGYYEGADGLTGTTLTSFLRTVVNTGFIGVNYGDARYILDETDRDPNNSNKVMLVYLGTSVSGVWDGGITWNREHVWPQSLLGVSADNDVVNAASDLHNLKPSNPSVNSSRGNKYFDNTLTAVSYVPRDAVKGDIARILFYMDVKYDNLTLVNSAPTTYQMAMLNTLLAWNDLDPVDAFERNRNEVIYSYQNNRNPFIDHPEFAAKIWGTVPTSQSDSTFLGIYTNTSLWVEQFIPNQELSNRSYIN